MKCRRLFLRLAVLAVTSTTLRATAQTGRDGNAPISVTSLPDSLIIIGTNEWLPIIYTFTNHTDVSIRIRDRLAYFLSFDRDVKTANGPLATSLTVPPHSIAVFPDSLFPVNADPSIPKSRWHQVRQLSVCADVHSGA